MRSKEMRPKSNAWIKVSYLCFETEKRVEDALDDFLREDIRADLQNPLEDQITFGLFWPLRGRLRDSFS